MNLFDMAENLITEVGERDLLKFGEEVWTNARLVSEAERFAALLMEYGVRPRDHVMLILPNGFEIFFSILALARLGCVSIPASIRFTPDELSFLAQDSDCKWVLTIKDFREKVSRIKSDLNVHVLDVNDIMESRKGGDSLPSKGGTGEDIAYIVYTSGTQGKPKGVMLTHNNIISEGRGVAKAFTVQGEDPADLTQLLVLPLSHSYGLMVMSMTYFMGNMTVILPRYKTESVLEAIRANQVKLMWAVPTMYILMLSHPRADECLKSVVQWDSGGGPLPISTLREIEDRFGGVVTDGYGCTEASGCVTTQSRKCYSPPGTQGFAIDGDKITVVSEDGKPVPDGKPGEFVISGATLMKGYWNKPELTSKVFCDEGYISGDIGMRHPDGYYVFLERKDDLIIRGGENVYPREIESALYQHPDVLEAAVKGIPDPTMGQEIKAFVSLKKGTKANEESLRNFLEKRIAAHKLPRYIEILPELPKNSTGKILRRKLPYKRSA